MVTAVLLWGALVPALLSATLFLAASRPWAASTAASTAALPASEASAAAGVGQPLGRWGAALALAAGYIAGHWGLAGGPLSANNDVSQTLLYLAALGGALGALDALWQRPIALRWGLRLLACAGSAWLLVRPLAAQGGPIAQYGLAAATVAGGMLAVWSILDGAAAREPGPGLGLALLLWVVAGAAVLVMAGTAAVGQLAGAAAAALGGLWVVTWRWPASGRLTSAAPVLALVAVGQWAVGLLYAELPKASFVLLVLAPLGLVLVQLPRLARCRPLTRHALRLGLVALLAIPAVALAARDYFAASASSPRNPAAGGESTSDPNYGY
ncbi:MAG: hypothetical protein IPL40_11590 [Proteobacteria bacterium]|nr:hypothetical protein [Pseudomonadota bacterium]